MQLRYLQDNMTQGMGIEEDSAEAKDLEEEIKEEGLGRIEDTSVEDMETDHHGDQSIHWIQRQQ